MKQRIINKKRNRFISEYIKLKRRNPEGNHKEFFTFDKHHVIEIINTINANSLNEYSIPIFLGEKRKIIGADLERIQRSTPLIIKSKNHEIQ